MTISILEISFLLRRPNSSWRQFNNTQRQKLKKTFSSIFQIDTYITDLLFDKHLCVVLDSVESSLPLAVVWLCSGKTVWFDIPVCLSGSVSLRADMFSHFSILVLTALIISWPLLLSIIFIYLFSSFLCHNQLIKLCVFFSDLLLCLIHIHILTAPLHNFLSHCNAFYKYQWK